MEKRGFACIVQYPAPHEGWSKSPWDRIQHLPVPAQRWVKG